jgi:hypothetical protein
MPSIRIIGEVVTTSQLAKDTAGGDNFIRTKGGLVKGLALRLDLNPDAPTVVIVGKGAQREARAKKLLGITTAIPAYMKRGVNDWEYIGDYRAIAYRTDKATIRRMSKYRKPNTVAGALYLEGVEVNDVARNDGSFDSIRNRGFPDPKTRKEIEEAAIKHVMQAFSTRGYVVHDHQKLNLGYDLCAVKNHTKTLIEVKGTDSLLPRFFLSRNERKCSMLNSNWRLAVVSQARTAPILKEYTAAQMETVFAFSALAWECTLS